MTLNDARKSVDDAMVIFERCDKWLAKAREAMSRNDPDEARRWHERVAEAHEYLRANYSLLKRSGFT